MDYFLDWIDGEIERRNTSLNSKAENLQMMSQSAFLSSIIATNEAEQMKTLSGEIKLLKTCRDMYIGNKAR